MKRRLLILGIVVILSVAFDQWIKIWADNNLATLEHPIALRVEAESETLDDVIKRRFPGLDEAERREVIEKKTRRLKKIAVDPKKPLRQDVHFFVFHRKDLSESPRHVHLSYRAYLYTVFVDWLNVPRKEALATIAGIEKKLTAGHVFLDQIFQLDESDLATVAKDFTYQLTFRRLTPDSKVKKGDVLAVISREVEVLKNFWHFVYAENPGSAWSFLATMPQTFRAIFFTSVSMIALCVILIVFFRVPSTETKILVGFALIVGGALGNVLDRIRLNCVIDFVRWHWYTKFTWPTFNIADALIVAGVGLLVLDILFNKNSVLAKRKPAPATPAKKKTKKKRG